MPESKNQPIYLDHNATTPIDPRVLEAMLPFFSQHYGNPGSLNHQFGWKSKAAVDIAREQVAELIGATPDEIIFTSGTTESNNFILHSLFNQSGNENADFIFSEIEHKSVLDSIDGYKKPTQTVHLLKADSTGTLDVEHITSHISEKTKLLGFIYANNEIGTIQPIKSIGRLAKEKGVFFFSDAAQAVGKIPVNVQEDQVDMLTISGHKMYGPKGIGAVYLRRRSPRVSLHPLLFGGGQEKGIRSGTLNVPGIVGLGKACEIAKNELADDQKRLSTLRDRFEKIILTVLPDTQINGNKQNRLPNTTHLTFPSISITNLASTLKKIAVSAGSACLSSENEPSYVLKAIGLTDALTRRSIRVGFGKFTTEEDMQFAGHYIIEVVKNLRH